MTTRCCGKCGAPGHYASTCGRRPVAKRERPVRVRYTNASNRLFVDALRDFLGLAPLYANAPAGKRSTFDVGELPARSGARGAL